MIPYLLARNMDYGNGLDDQINPPHLINSTAQTQPTPTPTPSPKQGLLVDHVLSVSIMGRVKTRFTMEMNMMMDRHYTRHVFGEQEPHWGRGLLGWTQQRADHDGDDPHYLYR